VTGPNIASQGILFEKLCTRLRKKINGPVITLRSGDVSNLKAALKQLIRDGVNQKGVEDGDEDLSSGTDVSITLKPTSMLLTY
jgi:origin recognition complex subunit 3